MTTSELITELQKQPPDMRVVIGGYEGGVSDVDGAEVISIELNCNIDEWYYGNHDECNESEEDEKAFIIGR